MRSVGAWAIVLIAVPGGLGEAGFDANALLDFQAQFTPVTVQPAGSKGIRTQPILPLGLAEAMVGIDIHSWRGGVGAMSPALGVTAILQVDYLKRYVSYTFSKAATPANAIKAEGCLKVTWPEGVLPPPPPAARVARMEQRMNERVDQTEDHMLAHVKVDGEKCITDRAFTEGHMPGDGVFSAKDSHLVLLVANLQMLEKHEPIPPPVENAIPPGTIGVGLKFSDYKSPMEPMREPTCVEGQEAAAIEALADPRTQAFVAALETHFQTVFRVVGGRSGHPLPAVNLTQALLSARRSTAISLKERDDGSSWVNAAFASVALVTTVAVAAFVAGARSGRRAEAPSYQHLLA